MIHPEIAHSYSKFIPELTTHQKKLNPCFIRHRDYVKNRPIKKRAF
jgi:hypothetical protein